MKAETISEIILNNLRHHFNGMPDPELESLAKRLQTRALPQARRPIASLPASRMQRLPAIN